MDDVFNSVPFLMKRKAAIEKEMESIEESMAQLGEQYESLEGEWGDKVAVMRKDYEGLKARYFNDTQESQMTGRSNVFVEVMSIVDDFERAKVRTDVHGDGDGCVCGAALLDWRDQSN